MRQHTIANAEFALFAAIAAFVLVWQLPAPSAKTAAAVLPD